MMELSALFEVEYGNKLDMNKMTAAARRDGVAFVGRIGGLNGRSGIAGYVQPIPGVEPYPPGLLTVALGGSRLLSTYVQQGPFYTAQNVAVLTPRDSSMPLLHRLYYAMCIKANDFRYSAFGREANRTLSLMDVPDGVPEWVDSAEIPTVEGLGRSLGKSVVLPHTDMWGTYTLASLFTLRKGRRVTKAAREPGPTRFIGASDRNNGVTDLCDLRPLFAGNTLTVPYNGSVGFAFYQDEPYFACDDVNVLTPISPMNKWALLFISAVIRFEKYRFTYGYKWTLARMKATTIRLPVDENGNPDWLAMEAFMKGLPFSAAIASEVDAEQEEFAG